VVTPFVDGVDLRSYVGRRTLPSSPTSGKRQGVSFEHNGRKQRSSVVDRL
jgi:hypothetical protein